VSRRFDQRRSLAAYSLMACFAMVTPAFGQEPPTPSAADVSLARSLASEGVQLADAGNCAAAIDTGRIAALMARDWGFHHTATANLARVQGAAAVEPRFGADPAARIDERAGLLLAAIDAEPKSRGWRLRDRIGERKQWWQDVDEKEATY